jgi:type IV secretory pathway protease TraF
MEPLFKEKQFVIASGLVSPKESSIVIFRDGGLEKIKYVDKVKDDRLYVLGYNPKYSTDSRHFGWISREAVVGVVIWP